MKKEIEILKEIRDIVEQYEECVSLDVKNKILYIHHGLSAVTIEEGIVYLSFNLDLNPIMAGNITKELAEYSLKNEYHFHIGISYINVYDEEGNCIETLTGDAAEYYYEHGEKHAKQEKIKQEVDHSKKLDQILDQISAKGIESLSKNQLSFMKKHSKSKA